MKYTHLMYCPFTGLGLYNGFRGDRWLRNRIKIFSQFVIPSLENQTSKNFILWISWRPEEKRNPHVNEFMNWLEFIGDTTGFKVVHTFHGLCFYDDKYEYDEARNRLLTNIHGSLGTLVNEIGECDYVLMTIQPSDDLYAGKTVEAVQKFFDENPLFEAVGFEKGYIADYQTKEVAEYNPDTNPPFYTIKFPRDVFIDPLKHVEHTAIRVDVGEYKAGTPLPSHEYVGDALIYGLVEGTRGFLVGTHGFNTSTNWNIPYRGSIVSNEVLKNFGIYEAEPLSIDISLVKRLYLLLPHRIQRKLRYLLSEKFTKHA